jgi:hypothetical protein
LVFWQADNSAIVSRSLYRRPYRHTERHMTQEQIAGNE